MTGIFLSKDKKNQKKTQSVLDYWIHWKKSVAFSPPQRHLFFLYYTFILVGNFISVENTSNLKSSTFMQKLKKYSKNGSISLLFW